jgi:N12 class adenine-specific DNA methylase
MDDLYNWKPDAKQAEASNRYLNAAFDAAPEAPPERSLPGEMASGLKRGLYITAPQMIGGAMKALSPVDSGAYRTGMDLQESAKAIAALPEMQRGANSHGIIGDSLVTGAEGLGQMAPVIAGGIINPALGSGIAGTMYGGSTYQDTKERMLEQEGLDEAYAAAHPDDPRVKKVNRTGLATGVVQAVGDAAMSYLGGRFLKGVFPAFGKQTAQGIARGIASPGRETLKRFGKAWGAEMLGEGITEAAQDEGQAAIERAAGLKDAPAFGTQALDSAQGGVGMAMLLGPLAGPGHYSMFRDARQVQRALVDPSTDPAVRTAAARVMGNEIAKVDRSAAANFLDHANDAIGDEQQTGSAPYALNLDDTALLEPFVSAENTGPSSGDSVRQFPAETPTPPGTSLVAREPASEPGQGGGIDDSSPLTLNASPGVAFDSDIPDFASPLAGMPPRQTSLQPIATPGAPVGPLSRALARVMPDSALPEARPIAPQVSLRGIAAPVIDAEYSEVRPALPAPPSEMDKAQAWAKDEVAAGRGLGLMQGYGTSDEQHAANILTRYRKAVGGDQGTVPSDQAPVTNAESPVTVERPSLLTPDASPSVASPLTPDTSRSKRRQLDPTKDDLVVAMAKLGGLDLKQAKEQWGTTVSDDAKELNRHAGRASGMGLAYAFKSGGIPLDRMREALVEHGYLPEGATINDLADAVHAAARGSHTYSNQADVETLLDRAEQQWMDRHDFSQALELTARDLEDTDIPREDEQVVVECYRDVADVLVDLFDELHIESYDDVKQLIMEVRHEVRSTLANFTDAQEIGTEGETVTAGQATEGGAGTGQAVGDQREAAGGGEQRAVTSEQPPVTNNKEEASASQPGETAQVTKTERITRNRERFEAAREKYLKKRLAESREPREQERFQKALEKLQKERTEREAKDAKENPKVDYAAFMSRIYRSLEEDSRLQALATQVDRTSFVAAYKSAYKKAALEEMRALVKGGQDAGDAYTSATKNSLPELADAYRDRVQAVGDQREAVGGREQRTESSEQGSVNSGQEAPSLLTPDSSPADASRHRRFLERMLANARTERGRENWRKRLESLKAISPALTAQQENTIRNLGPVGTRVESEHNPGTIYTITKILPSGFITLDNGKWKNMDPVMFRVPGESGEKQSPEEHVIVGKTEQDEGSIDDHTRNGGTGQAGLERNQSGRVSGNGAGQRAGRTIGGSRATDQARNGHPDVRRSNDRGGSVGGKPESVHLPDSETAEGSVQPVTPPVSEPRGIELRGDNPGNYRITADTRLGEGSRSDKIRTNLDAIRLLKQLEAEQRYPTRDEQHVLARYVGWGGLKSVFDPKSQAAIDQKTRQELESLLTKEEYFEARQSVLNAHYTSQEIIGAIYSVLDHMGFSGGNVLEPTYGSGNFIGLMPEHMAASSKWYGSELDPITARIGQHLYPDAQLLQTGFQNAEFPYGKFDLVIGNPPFGAERITDSNKKRSDISGFKIHNYVIAKSGMHLRPGGVMAMVVTSRFLDTADPEARNYLAKQFKFLGAIRLPNDAFVKNAGTEVTTDLVFFQKLMPGEYPDGQGQGWLTTGATMTNASGEEVTLNKWFAARPELMLGEPSMKGTMYGGHWRENGPGEFTLNARPGQDTVAELAAVIQGEAFDQLRDVFRPTADKADAAAVSLQVNREDVGIGGYFQENGQLFMRQDDDEAGNPSFIELTAATPWTEKQALGETRLNRIKGMLALRESAYDLINAERFDLPNIELRRKELNEVYDEFVKKYGFISDSANASLMADDVKIESGLEVNYRKSVSAARAKALGTSPSPAKADKASILKQRVFFPVKEVTSAGSVRDGYNVSLSERGRLDLEYIASLTGTTLDQVTKELAGEGLIFRDPESGEWRQEDEYLSGNVKAKLRLVEGREGFENNVEALKKALPADVPADEIFVDLGATWVPEEVYREFADLLGIQNPRILVSPETGMVKIVSHASVVTNDMNVLMQNEDYGIAELFNAIANKQALVAYDPGEERGTRVVNKGRTKALAPIGKRMSATFRDWIMADPIRAAKLAQLYNDTQNTHAPRRYSGEHLKTVGANPAIRLRNSQRNSAWRMIQSPVTLLDHVVGAGKTFTIITGVMERRRLGLSRKPMIVVPNHLVGQWAADFLKLYPGAHILAATKKDFEKKNRRRLFARIATGNFDAVIVGHSSFGFIPVEADTQREILMEEIGYLERALHQATTAEDKRTVRNITERIAKKREKIGDLMNRPADNVITFENMGIDNITVDECFPGDTPVITDQGIVPIGKIVDEKLDLKVLSLNLSSRVLEWKPVVRHIPVTRKKSLVRVYHEAGHFTCTADHKIWTGDSYVKASDLCDQELCFVRPGFSLPIIGENKQREAEILREPMRSEMEKCTAWCERKIQQADGGHSGCLLEGKAITSIIREDESEQPHEKSDHLGENEKISDRPGNNESRREWKNNSLSTDTCTCFGMGNGSGCENTSGMGIVRENTQLLQSGYSKSASHDCGGGGRTFSWDEKGEGVGQEEGSGIIRSRVVRVEVLQQTSGAGTVGGSADYQTVYDIEVADNHNYFAAGALVSNCHEYKNLEYSTSMQNITGMGNPKGAKKSFDLYAKIQYLRGKDGAVTFATGTPISNSLVEMYTILRYLNRPGLKARGLDVFDSWAKMYALIEPTIEYTASQKLKERQVMTTFDNLPAMLQLYTEFADVISMKDLKRIYAEQIRQINKETGGNEREEFPVPAVKNGGRYLDVADPTPAQKQYMEYLVARADRLERLGGQNDPKTDNHLWLMNDARKMALDIRLVDPLAPGDQDNKVNRAARNIKRLYDAWHADKGAQLVFCDLSTPIKGADKAAAKFIRTTLEVAGLNKDQRTLSLLENLDFSEQWQLLKNRMETELDRLNESADDSDENDQRREKLDKFLSEISDEDLSLLLTADSGFSVYDDLKRTLVGMGIKENEIAFIHDANNDKQKDELFARVNSGDVRVLIGSSKKMGAGTNAQERLVGLHHMDAPWRPSDVEQREGRIIRQGNKLYERDPENFQVEIPAYSTRQPFDAVMWQILARKAGMLDDFRSGTKRLTEEATDSANYAEFMAESTGNPIFREKFKLEKEIDELESTQRSVAARRMAAERIVRDADRMLADEQREVNNRKRDLDEIGDTSSFQVDGKEYADDLSEAYNRALAQYRLDFNEYETRLLPDYIAAKEQIEAQDLDAKEKAAALKQLKKPSQPVKPSLARLARTSRAAAAAVKVSDLLDDIPERGEVEFFCGGTQVVVDKQPGMRNGEYDFRVTINGHRVWDLGSNGLKRMSEAKLLALFSTGAIKAEVHAQYQRAIRSMQQLKASIADAQLTMEKVKFKDGARLDQMRERYRQVVDEVNNLEQDLAEKREQNDNRYISGDRGRFGSQFSAASESVASTPAATIEAALKSALKSSRIPIRVVQSLSDLPRHIQIDMRLYGIEAIDGVFDPRTNVMYLVADYIPSVERARELLRHEWFHAGVADKELEALYRYYSRKDMARLERIADERGFDLSSRSGRLEAAGELAAQLAETNPRNFYLARIVVKIKEWLRALGIHMEFGQAEVARIIRDAIQRAQTGPELAQGDRGQAGSAYSATKGEPNNSSLRSEAIPRLVEPVISSHTSVEDVKKHPDYVAAKAGHTEAAFRLVSDLVNPSTMQTVKDKVGEGAIFVAPHAEEMTGRNQIPMALAGYYANATNGSIDAEIIQTNQVHHTGADAMQRLISRPVFDGDVVKNGRYVLVDDATTLGGTLAELAHYIISNGGKVEGVVTLTNAMRNAKVIPNKLQTRTIERRYGDEIRELFHIDPNALTAPEASYLIGFKNADELRKRVAKARQERSSRLLSKGIRTSATEESLVSRQKNTPEDNNTPQYSTPEKQDAAIADHAAKIDAPGKVATMTTTAFELAGMHIPQKLKASIGTFLSNPWFGSEGKPIRRTVVNLNIQRSHVRNEIISDLFRASEGYTGVEGLHNILEKATTAELKQFNELIKYGDRNDVAKTFTRDELYRGKTPFGKLSRTVVEAYKAFHQIVQATNRVRFEKLSEIALVPYAKEPWYQELLDLLETRMRLDRELSPTEVGQLGKILSSTRRRMSDVELFGDNNPTGKPVTKKVADAYKKFMDQLAATSEPGLVRMAYKHITEYRGELDKLKNEWGYVKGYAPRMRKDGDWHVSVYRVDEDGNRTKVYMKPTMTEWQARSHVAKVQADLKQYLKGNFAAGASYKVEYERNTATPSELLSDRGSELAIEQLIMNAFDKANVFKTSAEDLASMKRAILDEVGKEIMAQGFGRHGISREKTQIEGYRDDDYVSVLKEFISGMAGWLSKMQYAVEVNREADRISAANPDDKVWVHDYFKDSMKNSTYLDEIAATARSVGALYYLGFKASSSLLNAFQNYTVGQAVLAGMMKKAGRKGEPILMLAKAQRDMVGFAMGKGTLTDEEQNVLRQAVRQGTARAKAVRYVSGLGEQGFGGAWKRFVEIGMTPFSWVEQYVNREPGVLAAYRAFKTTPKGQFDQKAFDLAEEFTNSSHFLMGNENLPEMVRKMGALGKTLYLFQGYVHNYLLLMANALKNGEFEVIARSLGAIAALGGVFALPGADDLDKWITKWFGVSYKLKFKLWMRRHSREYGSVGEALEAFVNYGAPSVAGVDMSRAISVNIPYIPDPQLSIGDNVLKFFGVWGGMVKKPVMAVQALGSGQYYRAIENIMPEAGANPMRAYRQATTGATTLAGKPILDETGRQMRYSGTDVAKKILGFQPMEVSQRTEMKSAERSLQDVWGDERKDHLAALRVARTREELRTAIQDVIRWNYRLHQSQAKGLVRPISADSIQRARRFTTTKADRSRMGWEQEYVD